MTDPIKYIQHLETPFFLFEEEPLLHELNALKNALKQYWNNFSIGYSVKTNSFPPLASYLHKQGVSAEVVSEDEYQLACRAGYTPAQLICNGPIKSRSWVKELLDKGILINIDSHRELAYACEYAQEHPNREVSVGIRINLDIEKEFPDESNAGKEGSRFGFCPENGELLKAIQTLNVEPNIVLSGLHLHISTKTRRVEIYRWLVCRFTELIHQYGLSRVQYLDIGGGFFGGLPNKPTWNDYLKGISEELRRNGFLPDKLKLIVEPGVSLLAGCFSYFCKVIDIKETNFQHFVTLDGSRIHIDPLMHKTAYSHEIIRQSSSEEKQPISERQQLTGFTCLENDRFFSLTYAPLLSEGDLIRFNKVGAYTLTLAPLFISYYPSVYLSKVGGEIECLRSKWSINEFLQLSKMP